MQQELERLRAETEHLRKLLGRAPAQQSAEQSGSGAAQCVSPAQPTDLAQACSSRGPTIGWEGSGHDLNAEQISRYSRQIILPAFGVAAQARLCRASVLVVGAGGLGSPAALYLAAAGVGRLGIVDRDHVELSNLHRQIAHAEARVGAHKADSAGEACRALNTSIQVDLHRKGFTPGNALALVGSYDVILDCTDNAASRYLISDACAVLNRPLVSGAALGTDGQLTVYCHGPDGPCYRCLFPEAPAAGACGRCSDAGVLGVAPGIIGTLQALEAIKLAAGVGQPLSRRLLLLDCLATRFSSIKLRGKMEACAACGLQPTITAATLPCYDYAAFTGQAPNDAAPAPLRLLPAEQRITPAQAQDLLQSDRGALILDVRPQEQFDMAHILGSHNCPYDERREVAFRQQLDRMRQLCSARGPDAGQRAVCVVCRRGNDSQHAVQLLRQHGVPDAVDVIGGLEGWAHQTDVEFPLY